MRRRPHCALARVAAALAAATLAAGCGGAPRRAPPKRPPEIVLRSEADERKVAKDASAEVEAEMGLVEEPALVAYVNQVGQRLLRFAPARDFDYRFRIVDQEAPNAFALPGGQIYVSRGLLLLANTEDELANVMAHEIMHAALRHASARQSMMQSIPGLFMLSAAGVIARYSREQEREADRAGQQLAAQAGYDPVAMASFLKDLDYTERLEFGASRLPNFLDTHPSTQERVAEATARGQSLSWQARPPLSGGHDGYLAKIDGLAVGTRASEGVFQGDRFLHAELGIALRFPEGWETKNTRQAVGAISPSRDAQVFLELQGKGEDPMRAAAEYLASDDVLALGLGLDAPPQPVRLGELDAARAVGGVSTPAGPIQTHLAWIAHQGNVYRLTGQAFGGAPGRYAGVFRSVERSFRPLTPKQRESIQETRLRIVPAREGEGLLELSQRTGNRWNLQQTAVMNDVFADSPLAAGQQVKVAVSERYEAPAEPPPR
jgi:predicted Zn-dependent protease